MEFGCRRAAVGVACCLAAAACAQAAELGLATVAAFESYIRGAEARIEARNCCAAGFLWIDESPRRIAQVRSGTVLSEPREGRPQIPIEGGLVHDWIGAVFIPGATLKATLALVQDYDRHQNIYAPEVVASKLLDRRGNEFKVYLRLLKKKILTVVLATEHDARYHELGPRRCFSRSYSTRIAELADAGKPGERELPPGKDQGFLWRLYSYWRFEERDGGVYVECEAISLTRAVPAGLGWLIDPIVRSLPRESLANTLRATRDALAR